MCEVAMDLMEKQDLFVGACSMFEHRRKFSSEPLVIPKPYIRKPAASNLKGPVAFVSPHAAESDGCGSLFKCFMIFGLPPHGVWIS